MKPQTDGFMALHTMYINILNYTWNKILKPDTLAFSSLFNLCVLGPGPIGFGFSLLFPDSRRIGVCGSFGERSMIT